MATRSLSRAAKAQSRPATAEQILAVVDKYQDDVLNLESFVGCIKAKVEAECEGLRLVGAIELLEHELARIGEALDPNQIIAACEKEQFVQDCQREDLAAVGAAAEETQS